MGAHGTRFGVGAYFAEDLSKSFQYAPNDTSDDWQIETNDGVPDSVKYNEKKWILLCRVLCGDMYCTEQSWEATAAVTARDSGKDSVLANPDGNGPREFIVGSADQVYPEYICLMGIREPAHKKGRKFALAGRASEAVGAKPAPSAASAAASIQAKWKSRK